MYRFAGFLSMIFVCLSFAGCGGDQSTNSRSLGGTAAGGAPLVGTVRVYDSAAGQATLSIDGSGVFIGEATGLVPPLLLIATGKLNGVGETITYYSYAESLGTVNANPVSHAIIALAIKSDPITHLSDPQGFGNGTGIATNIAPYFNKARETMRKLLAPVSPVDMGSFDPVTTPFAADGTGFDKLLDNLGIQTTGQDIEFINNNTALTMASLPLETGLFSDGCYNSAIGGITNAAAAFLEQMGDTIPPVPGSAACDVEQPINFRGIRFTWTAATDNSTIGSQLEYRFLYSLSDNIRTLADAQANGTILCNWTRATAPVALQLPAWLAQTPYQLYGAVLVRDRAGNIAFYQPGTCFVENGAPIPPAYLVVSSITAHGCTLSWQAATDDVTPQAELEYKVVKSTWWEETVTLAGANALTGPDIVVDWTPNLTGFVADNLWQSSYYEFTVLVRDAEGQMARYPDNNTGGQASRFFTPEHPGTVTPSGLAVGFTRLSPTRAHVYWSTGHDSDAFYRLLQYRLVYSTGISNVRFLGGICDVPPSAILMDWTTDVTNLAFDRAPGAYGMYGVAIRDLNGDHVLEGFVGGD